MCSRVLDAIDPLRLEKGLHVSKRLYSTRLNPTHAHQTFTLWSWYGVRQDGRLLWFIRKDFNRGEASALSSAKRGSRDESSRDKGQVGRHGAGYESLLDGPACMALSARPYVICLGKAYCHCRLADCIVNPTLRPDSRYQLTALD